MPVTVLILICSISTPRADCQIESALDQFYAPPVSNEVTCGMHGQALAAETLPRETLERIWAGLEYAKIKCQRSNVGANVG